MNANLDIFYDFSVIDNAQLADTTKAQYKKAVRNYLSTGRKLGDARSLSEYAQGLSTSSRSFLKAAVKLMSAGLALSLKSGATPDNVQDVQAALYRLEALDAAVQVKASKGEKAHIWLSQAQVKKMMSTCDDGLVGLRDWVVLGLMVAAGLRREELVSLSFDDLKEQPTKKNGMRAVLQVKGKGARDRVIPINAALARKIREWQAVVSDDGLIARSLGRKIEIGKSLSAIGLFGIVRKHGAMIGVENLDPHDLRRTYAQLGFEAGVPITQISKLLGHSDIATTQRYLNLDLDLETTVSDFIPLENGDSHKGAI